MSNNKHQWIQFANPRNGLIKIEACELCGIAKSMIYSSHQCTKENKSTRLSGWYKLDKADKRGRAKLYSEAVN